MGSGSLPRCPARWPTQIVVVSLFLSDTRRRTRGSSLDTFTSVLLVTFQVGVEQRHWGLIRSGRLSACAATGREPSDERSYEKFYDPPRCGEDGLERPAW